MAVITDEQRIGLERNPRYQDLCKTAIKNFAGFIQQNDGVDPPGVMTQVEWAKQRMIAARISLHPNSQDYNEWIAQMTIFLKGSDVWTVDEEATITAMIASGKFDELSQLTFSLRATREEF